MATPNLTVTIIDDKVLNFKTWYRDDYIKFLINSSNNPQKILRYVFSQTSDAHDNLKSFMNQFNAVLTLKNMLKKAVFFICTRPGEIQSSHFVLGMVSGNNLIFVDPQGEPKLPDFYKSLAKFAKGLNIYLSNSPIQIDPVGLVSCGPICVELFYQLSSQNIRIETLKTTKKQYSISPNELLNYFSFDIRDILNNALKQPMSIQAYQTEILNFRKSHYNHYQSKREQFNRFLSSPESTLILNIMSGILSKRPGELENSKEYLALKQDAISNMSSSSALLSPPSDKVSHTMHTKHSISNRSLPKTYQFINARGHSITYQLSATHPDRDCFFHAVNTTLGENSGFGRAALVTKLLENANNSEVLNAFAVEIFQFLYLGYCGNHEDKAENDACEKIMTSEIKALFMQLRKMEEIILRTLIDKARTELGEISHRKVPYELLFLLKERNSTLSRQFELTLNTIQDINGKILTQCASQNFFRNYVVFYLKEARGFIPLSRHFGENKKTHIDIINQLFNLNIQMYLAKQGSSLTAVNRIMNEKEKLIPIFHNGLNHFWGLVERNRELDEKNLKEKNAANQWMQIGFAALCKRAEKNENLIDNKKILNLLPYIKAMAGFTQMDAENLDKFQGYSFSLSRKNIKPKVSLAEDGLFSEVFLDSVIINDNNILSKVHQEMIDEYLYKEYYEKNRIEEELWRFGFFDYIETICCGKLLKNSELLETIISQQNPSCPHCKNNQEILDQLFCMYMTLTPYAQTKSRKTLTLEILQNAIIRKRYFLLSHLLFISPISQYINWYDKQGKTLLHHAIRSNDIIAVLILIKNGADINALAGFLHYPIDYLSLSLASKKVYTNIEPLKDILKTYGSYSNIDIKRPPNTYEGNILHKACRNANELLVLDLIRAGVDVGRRNCQNYTALETLAYFGRMDPNGQAISTLKLYSTLEKTGKKTADFLEILFSLHETGYITYKYGLMYHMSQPGMEPKFDISDDIYEYTGILGPEIHFGAHKGVFLDYKNFGIDLKARVAVYVCNGQNMDVTGVDTKTLYEEDAYFKGDILSWIKMKKTFSGNIVILPPMKQFSVIAILSIEKVNDVFSVKLQLRNFAEKNAATVFINKLQTWVKSRLAVQPHVQILNIDPASSEKFTQSKNPKLNLFVTIMKTIYEIMGNNVDAEKLIQEYCLFRLGKNMFLRKEPGDLGTFSDTGTLLNFMSAEQLRGALTISKQDSITELLYHAKPFVNVSLLKPTQNIFCIASAAYNYSFMKKMIELGVNPFPPLATSHLIDKLPYSFQMLYYLLSCYKDLIDPNASMLHLYVTLIDGSTKVEEYERGNNEVNALENLLIHKKEMLEARNQAGETPVFVAIYAKNLNAVNILIAKGSSLLVKNQKGKFPIDIKPLGESSLEKEMRETLVRETRVQMQQDIRRKSGKELLSAAELQRLSKTHGIAVTTEKRSSQMTFTFIPRVKESSDEDEILTDDGSDEEVDPVEKKQNLEQLYQKHQDEIFHLVQNKPDVVITQIKNQLMKLNALKNNVFSNITEHGNHIFTYVTAILQLIDHQSNIPQATLRKLEAGCIQKMIDILNNSSLDKIDPWLKIRLLVQVSITIGSIKESRKTTLLQTLADFLRGLAIHPKNALLGSQILSFLCDFLSGREEMLFAYTGKKILMGVENGQSINPKQTEIMEKHPQLFLDYAHRMGICCLSTLSNKRSLFKKEASARTIPSAVGNPLTFSAASATAAASASNTAATEMHMKKRKRKD